MSLSNLPPFYNMKWTKEDGGLTAESSLYNDQLFQTLNQSITLLNSLVTSNILTKQVGTQNSGTVINNGVKIPVKTTMQINNLEPQASIGTLWFDSDVSKLKIKTASGIIETITSN